MAATQGVSSKAPENCYLFKLPGELRSKIYTLVLLSPSEPIDVEVHHVKTKYLPPHSHMKECEVSLPPLLEVSAATGSEAMSIYLNSNYISFFIDSCSYCKGGLSTFNFNHLAFNIHHLARFEISSDYGVEYRVDFDMNITNGLSSRSVDWIMPIDCFGGTTRSIRKWAHPSMQTGFTPGLASTAERLNWQILRTLFRRNQDLRESLIPFLAMTSDDWEHPANCRVCSWSRPSHDLHKPSLQPTRSKSLAELDAVPTGDNHNTAKSSLCRWSDQTTLFDSRGVYGAHERAV